MMQTMRSSAKIVFFLVLVAFAGFMVLQGLTSIFSDPTRGGKAAPPGVIGSVDDIDIPVTVFENAYRPRLRELLDEEEEPSEERMAQVRDEVWSSLVGITTLQLGARRHGISVTDAEVAEYMRISPPQDLRQLPDFQTDSTFDLGKYQSWLRQVAASNQPELIRFLDGFENQIRQQILINRLQSFITATVQVTPLEVESSFREKNEKIKVRYLMIPGSEFSEEVADISSADVRARYESEKERYKRSEQAVVRYVQFMVSPSEDDYQRARGPIDSLYRELQAGADFEAMAREVSEDPGSGSKGGDLGWFAEGVMVEPFWNAVTALENIGDISEPVKTQFGWHLIKLTGKRDSQEEGLTEEAKTEYKASHILLRVQPSQETMASIEEKANNFIQDAVVYGFQESAEDFDLPVSETAPFTEVGMIPNLGTVPELSAFAFSAKVGDISDAITATNSVIVSQLKEIIPEGYQPFEEVRERIEQTIADERRAEMALARANELAMMIRGGKPFEEVAGENNRQVQDTDYFARSGFVPKVGADPNFIGGAFSLSEEKPVSDGIKTRSSAYILKLVDRQVPDSAEFAAQRDSLMQDTLNRKRREIWSRWVSSLRSEAQIEDYRSFYYGG